MGVTAAVVPGAPPCCCPAFLQGPRGFTSAAGFEAAARHKQHLEQHGKDADDGSYVVDTTHGAHTADSIKPAQTMDEHSLQGDHAPKFVGGDLVDPAEPTASTGAKADPHGSNAGTWSKSHPHGVYSLVRQGQLAGGRGTATGLAAGCVDCGGATAATMPGSLCLHCCPMVSSFQHV